MDTMAVSLPISALTAGVLGVLAIVLSIRVVIHRARTKQSLNLEGDPGLNVAGRVFGNFTEYVPIALILLGLAEITGSSANLLWITAGLLIAGRVIHIFGLSLDKPVTVARVVGTLSTWASIGLGSVLALMHAAA